MKNCCTRDGYFSVLFEAVPGLRVDLERSELISVSEKWGMWNLVCLQTTWDCEGEK